MNRMIDMGYAKIVMSRKVLKILRHRYDNVPHNLHSTTSLSLTNIKNGSVLSKVAANPSSAPDIFVIFVLAFSTPVNMDDVVFTILLVSFEILSISFRKTDVSFNSLTISFDILPNPSR